MARITIKDVARQAGVSTTTVSHVINNTRHVEDSTRQKVLETMEALGYHPNTLARSLRSGETRTIGLIVPDASNLFFADIAKRIENIGYENGYSVILCNSDNNMHKQRNYIDTLIAKQVDGAIFISSGESDEDLERLRASHTPLVVADRIVPLSLADVVLIDNALGGYLAARHLLSLGHTRIACISGPSEITPSRLRVEGYRTAMAEANIPIPASYIIAGDFQFRSGVQGMQYLMNLEPRPTAVFVLNDMMAIGAISAAHRLGLDVPEDVSIVGFDNIDFSTAVFPSLTTVAQPMEEIAKLATELLIKKMQDAENADHNQEYLLKPHLVVRESTRAWKG
jgi:LacI family transcriptional regulator